MRRPRRRGRPVRATCRGSRWTAVSRRPCAISTAWNAGRSASCRSWCRPSTAAVRCGPRPRQAELGYGIALCDEEFSRLDVRYAADYAYWNLSAVELYAASMRQYVVIIRSLKEVVDRRFSEGYIAKGDRADDRRTVERGRILARERRAELRGRAPQLQHPPRNRRRARRTARAGHPRLAADARTGRGGRGAGAASRLCRRTAALGAGRGGNPGRPARRSIRS